MVPKIVLSKESWNIENRVRISKETGTKLKNIERDVHQKLFYRRKRAPKIVLSKETCTILEYIEENMHQNNEYREKRAPY